MNIKTISVEYQRKLNLGNYNSATMGVTLWADVEEGEDRDEAITRLQGIARNHVKAEYERLKSPVAINGTRQAHDRQ